MADREQLMTALRNAHNSGDVNGARRIAAMISSEPTVDSSKNTAFDTARDIGASALRTVGGIPLSVANAGVSLVNSVKSAGAWAGKKLGIGNGEYIPVPEASYGEAADQYLRPRGEYEKTASDIGASLLTAPLLASRAAPAATKIGRLAQNAWEGAAQTAPQTMAAHHKGASEDAVGMLKDIAVGGVLGAGFGAASGLVQRGARAARESFGEITPELAARQANPEYVNRVAAGGEDFQSVIRDQNGNLIVNPSQVLNPETQPSIIRAQQREMRRLGEASPYTQNINKQKSASSLISTAEKMDSGERIQDVMKDTHQAFKDEAKIQYDEARNAAQQVLNDHGVSQIGMADTKQATRDLLKQHKEMGNQLFNSETTSMLKSFENVKFKDLKTVDKWKSTLSNRARKAQLSGDYDSANALRDIRSKMLSEFDEHLNSLDENVGSIYRDADAFYRDHVEDFGSKSLTGKMMDAQNPDKAAKMLTRGENAPFHTKQIMDALERAKQEGTIPEAEILQKRLAQAIGDENRRMAVEHTERLTNSSMNPNTTTLGNDLLKARESTRIADQYAGTNELTKNETLQQGIDTYRTAPKALGKTNLERAAEWAGAASGGGAGQLLHPVGGMMGAMAGKKLVEEMFSSGLIDNLARRGARGKALVEYLSDPSNAARVQEVLQRGYGRTVHNATVKQLQDAVRLASGGFINADEEQP